MKVFVKSSSFLCEHGFHYYQSSCALYNRFDFFLCSIPTYFFGMTIVGGKVVIGGSKLPAILREF